MNENSIVTKSKSYWQEQREYFKEKTIAFKELKKERYRNNDEINKNKK